MDSDNETGPSGEEAGSGDAAELVKVLMQERRKREEEVAEERRQREREIEQQRKQMQEQMDLLMKLVKDQTESRAEETRSTTVGREVKFSRLTDSDDIEAYLTTFERTMNAFKITKEQWVYKLAPQLESWYRVRYLSVVRMVTLLLTL